MPVIRRAAQNHQGAGRVPRRCVDDGVDLAAQIVAGKVLDRSAQFATVPAVADLHHDRPDEMLGHGLEAIHGEGLFQEPVGPHFLEIHQRSQQRIPRGSEALAVLQAPLARCRKRLVVQPAMLVQGNRLTDSESFCHARLEPTQHIDVLGRVEPVTAVGAAGRQRTIAPLPGA